MPKFIYVFDADGRDRLLALKYELLKSDEEKEVFVFLNKPDESFAETDLTFALSDILTF